MPNTDQLATNHLTQPFLGKTVSCMGNPNSFKLTVSAILCQTKPKLRTDRTTLHRYEVRLNPKGHLEIFDTAQRTPQTSLFYKNKDVLRQAPHPPPILIPPHQSTTYYEPKHPAFKPAYFNPNKFVGKLPLVGFRFAAKGTLINRIIINEPSTYSRSYAFPTKEAAEMYMKFVLKEHMWAKSYQDLVEHSTKNFDGYNEVMARVQWLCDYSSQIVIYEDNRASRLLAILRAKYINQILTEDKEYYSKKPFGFTDGYQVPISFWSNTKGKSLRVFTKVEQAEEVKELPEDDIISKILLKAIKEEDYQFVDISPSTVPMYYLQTDYFDSNNDSEKSRNKKISDMVIYNKDLDNWPLFYALITDSLAMQAFVKLINTVKDHDTKNKWFIDLGKMGHSNGWSGMTMAMANGNLESIKLYIQMILDSSLPATDKLDLIAAKNKTNGIEGASALHNALVHGWSNAVKLYLKLILDSELNNDDKINLIKCDYNGEPAFHTVLEKGLVETANIYIDAILNSNLPLEDKVMLLSAKTSEGFPGLFVALQLGQTDAVKIYLSKVLGSSDIGNTDKMQLLTAMSAAGFPGLVIAFAYNNVETANIYIDAILNSNLPKEDKVTLLAAKTSEGLPGLSVALDSGYTDLVDVFLKSVLKSNLSTEEKLYLLLAKSDSGMFAVTSALNNGHNNTVKIYLEIVATYISSISVDTDLCVIIANLKDKLDSSNIALITERFQLIINVDLHHLECDEANSSKLRP